MRRRLIQLGLFVVLGAIVNVAVAWGCAAAPTQASRVPVAIPRPNHRQSHSKWELIEQIQTVGKTQNWYGGPLREHVRITNNGRALTCTYYPMCGNDDSGPWDVTFPIQTARWSKLGYVTLARKRVLIYSEIAAGWPAIALWGCAAGYDRETADPMQTNCIALGERQTGDFGTYRAITLPLRPLWPGFAINTMFYAGILWLLFAAPFALRRRFRGGRIKRGLCPACAYPVGDSEVCTECGRPVRPKEITA